MNTSDAQNGAQIVAAIDVGSNTVHLAVARVDVDRRGLRIIEDTTELVRLGADVAATGSIGAERASRAIAAIGGQAARARELGATAVLGIATEGVRAARNGAAFLARVQRETGVAFALVTGEQEAALTYWGAASEGAASAEPLGVVDLGGGSLELVLGRGDDVLWRVSLPLGSGTLHDRYAPGDPPTAGEQRAVRQAAEGALASTAPPLLAREGVACGGTATTLLSLAVRTHTGETERMARMLSNADLDRLSALLRTLPAAQLTERFGIEDGRARLLGAGVVVMQAALAQLGLEQVRVSRRGIREGAILARACAGDEWLGAATVGRLMR